MCKVWAWPGELTSSVITSLLSGCKIKTFISKLTSIFNLRAKQLRFLEGPSKLPAHCLVFSLCPFSKCNMLTAGDFSVTRLKSENGRGLIILVASADLRRGEREKGNFMRNKLFDSQWIIYSSSLGGHRSLRSAEGDKLAALNLFILNVFPQSVLSFCILLPASFSNGFSCGPFLGELSSFCMFRVKPGSELAIKFLHYILSISWPCKEGGELQQGTLRHRLFTRERSWWNAAD